VAHTWEGLQVHGTDEIEVNKSLAFLHQSHLPGGPEAFLRYIPLISLQNYHYYYICEPSGKNPGLKTNKNPRSDAVLRRLKARWEDNVAAENEA
jgi:hypothetical protein